MVIFHSYVNVYQRVTILARTWFFMDLAVVTVDWVLTALAAQQEARLDFFWARFLEGVGGDFPWKKNQGSTTKMAGL